jgi:hypothetical protein
MDVVEALAAVKEDDPTPELRLRATLALVSIGAREKPLPFYQSLLALLDVCVAWPQNKTMGTRELAASPELERQRKQQGLPAVVSESLLRTDHLRGLATLCGVERLTQSDDKKQRAWLLAEMRERLKGIRPYLVDIIRKIEQVDRQDREVSLALDIPRPSVIIAGSNHNAAQGSPK